MLFAASTATGADPDPVAVTSGGLATRIADHGNDRISAWSLTGCAGPTWLVARRHPITGKLERPRS